MGGAGAAAAAVVVAGSSPPFLLSSPSVAPSGASLAARLLPDARIPPQWTLSEPISAADMERLLAVADAVRFQDRLPFRSGLLSAERFASAFPAGFPLDLPPIPLDLESLLATDPSSLDLPTSGSVRFGDLEGARIAADCLASGALRPLRHDEVALGWAPLFSLLSSKKARLIFDLRTFNSFLSDPSFLMETLIDLPLLAAGCTVGGKLDCKSAYFQYPISENLQQHMCCFQPGGRRRLAWTVLPFGLSHAPKIWTRLLANLVRLWRSQGMVVLAYLDDIILLARDPAAFTAHASVIVTDLINAGIRLSASKFFFAPFSQFEALGLIVDLVGQGFVVPDERIDVMVADATAMLANVGAVRARDIESFIGRTAFCALACPWLAFFRAHLCNSLRGLAVDGRIPSALTIALGPDAVEELNWWRTEARPLLSGRTWPWRATATTRLYSRRGDVSPFPDFVGASDASAVGVGFRRLQARLAAELFPPDLDSTSPSCARELYGLARCIEAGGFPPGSVVRLLTDARAAFFTWSSPSVAPSTARYARRLFLSALAARVTVQLEWTPRETLEPEDRASRAAARDMAHATVPRAYASALIAEAVGACALVDAEFFASPGSATFTDAPCGARLPNPDAPLGDGLSSAAWRTCAAGWAFPPFCLAKALADRVASSSVAPRAVLLLPDLPLVRFALRQWRVRPGPRYLYAPPDFNRRVPPAVPLLAFLPPQGPSPAASVCGRGPM